jgi:hypothetical protein
MKLFLPINATGDLPGSETVDNGGDSPQKVVALFFRFDTVIKMLFGLIERLKKSTLGAGRHLTPHQDSELVDFLPFVVECEEGADLEVSSCTVNRPRNLAPVMEVTHNLPINVAVIDDEQITAARTGAVWHLKK